MESASGPPSTPPSAPSSSRSHLLRYSSSNPLKWIESPEVGSAPGAVRRHPSDNDSRSYTPGHEQPDPAGKTPHREARYKEKPDKDTKERATQRSPLGGNCAVTGEHPRNSSMEFSHAIPNGTPLWKVKTYGKNLRLKYFNQNTASNLTPLTMQVHRPADHGKLAFLPKKVYTTAILRHLQDGAKLQESDPKHFITVDELPPVNKTPSQTPYEYYLIPVDCQPPMSIHCHFEANDGKRRISRAPVEGDYQEVRYPFNDFEIEMGSHPAFHAIETGKKLLESESLKQLMEDEGCTVVDQFILDSFFQQKGRDDATILATAASDCITIFNLSSANPVPDPDFITAWPATTSSHIQALFGSSQSAPPGPITRSRANSLINTDTSTQFAKDGEISPTLSAKARAAQRRARNASAGPSPSIPSSITTSSNDLESSSLAEKVSYLVAKGKGKGKAAAFSRKLSAVSSDSLKSNKRQARDFSGGHSGSSSYHAEQAFLKHFTDVDDWVKFFESNPETEGIVLKALKIRCGESGAIDN